MKNLPTNKQIWKIANPIILSLLAQNVVNVVDTAFLGRVGEVELGAAAIAIIFYVVLYMLGFGFSIGAQILMARRHGEGNTKEVGRIMDHSLYFMFGMGVVLFIIIRWFSPEMLRPFIASDEIFHASVSYLQNRIYGVFFAFFNVMSRAFFVSITRTRILTWSAALMAIVNVLLDYAMIFGHWGFPQMGIAGAALASAIAEGASAAVFLIGILKLSDRSRFKVFRFPCPQWAVIRKTLEVSVFVMIQHFISLSAWFLFFIIIEKMGERSLAISNIIRSIYMVLMIPVWAFSSTTNTLVSNTIGAGHKEHVMPIIRKITLLSLASVAVLMIPLIFIPGHLIRVYTSDVSLVAAATPSLYMIFLATLIFASAQNMFSGVSGTGNTRDALLIETFTLMIYLFFAWLIGIYWKQPITLVWLCEHIYFVLLGLFSWLYLKSGRWQHKTI